jgi:hypothetical protein
MRRLAVLAALLPLAALAQPDPYAPTPLAPGTFEMTVTDGTARDVAGTAVFVVHPAALGGGWTLLLDDGTDLVAFERASAPGLAGASFGDARAATAAPGAVLAYVRFDDASAGVYSTGAAPPASPNRLAIAETDDAHTVGAFDFSAVRVDADGTERGLRLAGRFHALDEPDDGGSGSGGTAGGSFPPLGAGRDCPAVWDWVGGIYGGMGSWSGYVSTANVGGPVSLVDGQALGSTGWQFQLANGCNQTLPGAYVSTFGHTATGLRAGIYRITNAFTEELPGPYSVTAGLGQMYGRAYVYVSGYFWISSVGRERVAGTYSGYAAPIPVPNQPSPPVLFTYGRFSARRAGPIRVDLPPGVSLPPGTTLPPGVEIRDGDD